MRLGKGVMRDTKTCAAGMDTLVLFKKLAKYRSFNGYDRLNVLCIGIIENTLRKRGVIS